MRGDLHTLKKVCLYGSKVMLVGMIVLGTIAAVLAALGIGVVFMDHGQELLQDILDVDLESDSTLRCVSAFTETLLIFLLAMVTVFCIHTLMVSIYSEHSPFTDDNVHVVKTMSFMYLGAAVVFAVLEACKSCDIASVLFLFFGCVLISTVLYILALVVRYGAVLQNESDHTL